MRGVMLVVLVLATALPATAHRAPQPCSGSYVLDQNAQPLLSALVVLDGVELSAHSIGIRSGCSSGSMLRTRIHKGWRVGADWRRCGRYKRLRLRVVPSADCRTMTGMLRVGSPRMRRRFTALRSECDDGIVDVARGESCEPPNRGSCAADCTVAGGSACGNGVIDAGEECDDGNTTDTDACSNTCRRQCGAQEFASTWAAIQSLVFARHGCTDATCHGATDGTGTGSLDLRPETAYASLIAVPSTADPATLRVAPGVPENSLLFRKLAAGTSGIDDVPGAPMPFTGTVLSADELEAVRLWIRAGASKTATVPGTATLLDACVGAPRAEADPLPPPAPADGLQLYAPPWTVRAHGEDEVCFSTWYDVEAAVAASRPEALLPCPPEWGGAGEQCFSYAKTDFQQDTNSHHSIIRFYRGSYPVTDPGFGTYTCHGGDHDGAACDPTAANPCGARSACAGSVRRAVACNGYGPPDMGLTVDVGGSQVAPSIGGGQSPHIVQPLPDGVYRVLPVRGTIVWNSHAFNLTDVPTTNEQWLNLYFVGPASRQHPAIALADGSEIFVADVPAFTKHEYCNDYTFPVGTQLIELSSHTHKRGTLFRIWDPAGALIYTSTTYADPFVLRFDPPRSLGGTWAQRRFHYCALYDNGFTDPSQVKRRSTSPPSPFFLAPGGPCDVGETSCLGGPHQGTSCSGNDATCGAGGVCDACPLRGGVTTEDEMFILLGEYYTLP